MTPDAQEPHPVHLYHTKSYEGTMTAPGVAVGAVLLYHTKSY